MNQSFHDDHWNELNKLTFDLVNKKIGMLTPLGREAGKRKQALMYRWAAVSWHVSAAEQLVGKIKCDAQLDSNRGMLPHYFNQKLYHTGFIFDDVIFNLISMFDYFSGFIDLPISKDRCKRPKWNSFVNRMWNSEYKETNVVKLLESTHRNWVNKLADYRASVYHEKTDPGSLEYLDDIGEQEVKATFFVPEGAIRALPIFKGRKKVELISGLYELIDKSSRVQAEILKELLEGPFPPSGPINIL